MDSKEIQKAFGKRVRDLRKEKGLTQEELAEAIDRSVDTVSNIERGFSATKLSTAAMIADQMDIQLFELFSPDLKTIETLSPDIQHKVLALIELIGEEKLSAHLVSLLNTLKG